MKTLPRLNFSKFNFRFKKSSSGEPLIFDSIRKKWLVLTPEEWVRQNIIQELVKSKGYPTSMFKIETGLSVNQNIKRSDVVVYKNSIPFVLIECKAPTVHITEKVFEQAANYNLTLHCPYIILSNGIQHVSFHIQGEVVVPNDDFPSYF